MFDCLLSIGKIAEFNESVSTLHDDLLDGPKLLEQIVQVPIIRVEADTSDVDLDWGLASGCAPLRRWTHASTLPFKLAILVIVRLVAVIRVSTASPSLPLRTCV